MYIYRVQWPKYSFYMNQVQLSTVVMRLIVGLIDACWDNKIISRSQHFFPQNCSGLINIHDLVSQSGNRCSAIAAAQKALIGH